MQGVTETEHTPALLWGGAKTKRAVSIMESNRCIMCNGLQMGTTRTSDSREDNSLPCYTLKIRGGCDTYLKTDGKLGTAGKGPLIQTEVSATLGVTQDQTLFVWSTAYKGEDEHQWPHKGAE